MSAVQTRTSQTWLARTTREATPGRFAAVLFPLGMYAAASIRLGDVTHISVIRRFGLVEVWAALATLILTFIAMIVAKTPKAWVARQVTAAKKRFHRRRQSTRVPAARPGPMQRYKFQAIVNLLPSASQALPTGQPPTHAVIRADNHHGPSGGMFTGLVLSWESSPVVAADEAIATVVAYGPDPAACLPIGGTFALWQGTDLAVGTVTRKLFL